MEKTEVIATRADGIELTLKTLTSELDPNASEFTLFLGTLVVIHVQYVHEEFYQALYEALRAMTNVWASPERRFGDLRNQLALPLHFAVATTLCRVTPTGIPKQEVDWLDVADDFVTSVAGAAALVPREDYDRMTTALRDTRAELAALQRTKP
jgi:hypothetical protein